MGGTVPLETGTHLLTTVPVNGIFSGNGVFVDVTRLESSGFKVRPKSLLKLPRSRCRWSQTSPWRHGAVAACAPGVPGWGRGLQTLPGSCTVAPPHPHPGA